MKKPANLQPRTDPLIDEVRSIRAALSNEHGNDVRRLCEHLQAVQQRHPERIVRRTAEGQSAPPASPASS